MALHTNDEYFVRLHEELKLDRRPELDLRVQIMRGRDQELLAATLKGAVILAVEPPREMDNITEIIPEGYSIQDILLDRRLEAIRTVQKPLRNQFSLVTKSAFFGRMLGEVRYGIPTHASQKKRKEEIILRLLEEMDMLSRMIFRATRDEVKSLLTQKRA